MFCEVYLPGFTTASPVDANDASDSSVDDQSEPAGGIGDEDPEKADTEPYAESSAAGIEGDATEGPLDSVQGDLNTADPTTDGDECQCSDGVPLNLEQTEANSPENRTASQTDSSDRSPVEEAASEAIEEMNGRRLLFSKFSAFSNI